MIMRPPNFKFKAGDYLFLKIPKIAKYEWHPFTISSAPQKENEIWVHIRSLGSWTNKLHEYFNDLASIETKSHHYHHLIHNPFHYHHHQKRKSNSNTVIDINDTSLAQQSLPVETKFSNLGKHFFHKTLKQTNILIF